MLAMQVLQQMIWQIGTLLYAPVFWLMVVIVYWQSRQRAKQKQQLFYLQRESVVLQVVGTVLIGLSGGLLASVLLLLLGVSVEKIGLEYLWMIALLLLCVRQRFLCFAYSGGILAASNCLWGWPALDGAQLLAMVAVLHCTEAFLVLTTGHWNALPIYLYDEHRGMTGAFLLQMVWPLPLVMLLRMPAALPQAGFLLMPGWWPMLSMPHDWHAVLYCLTPVLAALGYSDVAVHGRLREKTRQSAALLLLYSGMLLLLIWGTQHYNGGLLLPALFAPLGHEAIIQYGKWQAKQGKGGLLAPEWGVLILDVQHGSPAARAGLRSEDWILQLNGQPVENRQQFLQQQYFLPPHVQVDYMRRGKHKQCRMRMGHWNQPGIITAPDAQCNVYWMLGTDEGFIKVLYKFLSKKLVKTLKKK